MHEASEGICHCGASGTPGYLVMARDGARDSVRIALLVTQEASRCAGMAASLQSLSAMSVIRQGA